MSRLLLPCAKSFMSDRFWRNLRSNPHFCEVASAFQLGKIKSQWPECWEIALVIVWITWNVTQPRGRNKTSWFHWEFCSVLQACPLWSGVISLVSCQTPKSFKHRCLSPTQIYGIWISGGTSRDSVIWKAPMMIQKGSLGWKWVPGVLWMDVGKGLLPSPLCLQS